MSCIDQKSWLDKPVFKGGREKIYDFIPKNQVGTDEDFLSKFPDYTPLRTVTSHNDSNSIYVAPNGSDGGAGTSSDPFLTIQYAVNNLGGKSIVTVIRNGYIGDMIFNENVIINSSITLQVEAGETAEIRGIFPNYWAYDGHSGRKYINSNNRILKFGDSSSNLYYSDNSGISWTLSGSYGYFIKDIIRNEQTGSLFLLIENSPAGGYSILKSTNNGTTFPTGVDTGSARGRTLGYIDNRILCNLDTGIIRYTDNDGTSFNSVTFNCNYFATVNNTLLTISSNKIYYSTDKGINWNVTQSPTKNYNNFYLAKSNRLFTVVNPTIGTNSEIGYSDDWGINWNFVSITGYLQTTQPFAEVGGWLFVGISSGFSTNNYAISRDNGASWINYNASFLTNSNMGLYSLHGKLFYGGYQIIFSMLHISGNSITIDGFKLNPNYNTPIVSSSPVLNTYKYCNFYNSNYGIFAELGIYGFPNQQVYNSIFRDFEYGVISGDADIQECEFYNIENYAVDVSGASFTFEHNTVYLAKIGLLIRNAVSSYNLTNNLFFKTSNYSISSLTTQLIVSNSVCYGTLYNVIYGAKTKTGILNPLFRAEADGEDLRIQVVENGNIANSIAKQNANDNDGGTPPYVFDSGCYLIRIELDTDTYTIDITLDYPPTSDIFKDTLTTASITDLANGDIQKDYEVNRREIELKWESDDESSINFYNDLKTLMLEKNPIRFIPHTDGFDNGIGNFNATNLTLTIPASRWQTDYFKNYGVKLGLTGGDKYFKIQSNTDTILTLSNEDGYTGLGNENNISYTIEFMLVKSALIDIEATRPHYRGYRYNELLGALRQLNNWRGFNLKLVQTEEWV